MVCFRHRPQMWGMAYGSAQAAPHEQYASNQSRITDTFQQTQVNYGRSTNQASVRSYSSAAQYMSAPISIGNSQMNRMAQPQSIETIVSAPKERIVLDSPPAYDPITQGAYSPSVRYENSSNRERLSRDISRELASSHRGELQKLIQSELQQTEQLVQYNV